MRLKAAIFAVTLFCIFFVGFQSTYAQHIKANNLKSVVSYQTELDYPPFKYIENKSLTGYDIELSRLIFDKKYNLQFSNEKWDNVYEKLKSGGVDTCGLLTVNAQRKNEILFSSAVSTLHIAVYSNTSNRGLKNLKLNDLKKYRIGVGKGQYAGNILKNQLKIQPYRTFQTLDDAVYGLKDGEIDLLFENQEAINYLLIRDDLESRLTPRISNLYPVETAYGIAKENPELVKYINTRLKEIRESGEYETLYQKYFFGHSESYYKNQRRGVILYISFSVLLLAFLFAGFQLYIRHLKRKIIREQDFSKSIITAAKTIIIVCDGEGTIVLFNDFAKEVSGYSAQDVEGEKIYEISFLNEGLETGGKIYECMQEHNTIQNMEGKMKTNEDRILYILWNMEVIKGAAGKFSSAVVTGIDITDRKDAEYRLRDSYQELEATHEELLATEEELKEQYDDLNVREKELKSSEERYRLAVEGVNDGIWDWDGKDGRLFMSKRSRMIMGLNMEEEFIVIEDWFKVLLREDMDKFIRNFNKYITEPQKKHFQIEYRIKTPDGLVKWIRTRGMAIWDEGGIPIRVAGSNTDITDQKLSEERIHQLAFYDAMTELPNRTLLLDRFNIAAANAQRRGKIVAIFFLDLDNFKTINDTIGHSFGDQLLMKVGNDLKMRLRKGDTIARLGGDEFIMLQANINHMSEVYHLAARMLDVFRRPWILNGHEFYVTASIGISMYPNDGKDLQVLMKNADTAMYKAKETGKNNFQIYTQEMNLRMMERMEIEGQLRKAIDKDELLLYYQPQIELETGVISGVEALLRWSNPILGWIMPDTFIHIAEETGMIYQIGEWVLWTACRQLARWYAEGIRNLKMSVNLSAGQFQKENLVELVRRIIKETGIKADWLELEITESVAMKNLDYTIVVLKQLREMGIGISLDDFGTGYSSLNYLMQLPISNLKIDKTFVHDITNNSKQAKIAKTLISLAHSMNLSVTAEGVDNTNQLEFLINEKCDNVQGYLFSKPKPVSELDLAKYEIIRSER